MLRIPRSPCQGPYLLIPGPPPDAASLKRGIKNIKAREKTGTKYRGSSRGVVVVGHRPIPGPRPFPTSSNGVTTPMTQSPLPPPPVASPALHRPQPQLPPRSLGRCSPALSGAARRLLLFCSLGCTLSWTHTRTHARTRRNRTDVSITVPLLFKE